MRQIIPKPFYVGIYLKKSPQYRDVQLKQNFQSLQRIYNSRKKGMNTSKFSKQEKTGRVPKVCKPLEETVKSVEITLQHSHCTWVQLQVTEREKCDHHYQNQSGKIGHSSLQDQIVAEPRHTNIL